MAKKKVIKDVEAEEKVKKNKKKKEEVEEVTEVEEVVTEASQEVEETKEKNTKSEKEEKDTKKDKEVQTKKDGYFTLVGRELKKVVWPKPGIIVKYSVAVIIFCIILCLFFVGIDLISSLIKGLFV